MDARGDFWVKLFFSGSIKGSWGSGKWDPGKFQGNQRLVKYYSIWPDGLYLKTTGTLFGRLDFQGVVFPSFFWGGGKNDIRTPPTYFYQNDLRPTVSKKYPRKQSWNHSGQIIATSHDLGPQMVV